LSPSVTVGIKIQFLVRSGAVIIKNVCETNTILISKATTVPRYRYTLKVPKCEISSRLDFHDFHTIKPFLVGDFGARI
jgi:hypothetical protein